MCQTISQVMALSKQIILVLVSSAHPPLSDDSFLLEALSLADSSPGKASNRKMNPDDIP